MTTVQEHPRRGVPNGPLAAEAKRRFGPEGDLGKPTKLQATASAVFKPYIVRRPNGGCQVLFPLSDLDRLVDKVLALQREGLAPKGEPR